METATATQVPPHAPAAHAGHAHGHTVPLWGLFLALLALTAAEVGLYEAWSHSHAHAVQHGGEAFMPKYVMVLIILIVLTLPKAAIVLIYFMHIKFEKQLIVLLALAPLATAALAVLPTLTDVQTLNNDGKARNHLERITGYGAQAPSHGQDAHAPAAAEEH